MRREELAAVFDRQAKDYDKQWAKMTPIRECLHFLLDAVFGDAPENASALCVGAGTGAELAYLAGKFPRWRFTVVEPSGAMLEVCRRRAEEGGFAPRCHFHEGYVDSLPIEDTHDAATCFLVSQFILEQEARARFFRDIADRLRPGAVLASSDLASGAGAGAGAYEALLRVWFKIMAAADVSPEGLERMRAAYDKDVAVLPPGTVASIIESGGFGTPVQFFQAGLLHAWFAKRART